MLTNDTDPDAGPKSIASVTQPANGTVAITGGGTGLTYQPNPNYCNDPPGTTPSTFTYTLNGGSTATVSVTVTCVNDAPVADDETFNGANGAVGNTSLVVNAPGDGAPTLSSPKKSISGDILAGDTDVDGPGPLTVTAGTFATNDGGSVTIEADGDFTYINDPADNCADTSDFFDYTVTDQKRRRPRPDARHRQRPRDDRDHGLRVVRQQQRRGQQRHLHRPVRHARRRRHRRRRDGRHDLRAARHRHHRAHGHRRPARASSGCSARPSTSSSAAPRCSRAPTPTGRR